MHDELREHRGEEGEGDQEKDHAGRDERDPVAPESHVEELPRGAALYRLGNALERYEDLGNRLGLLDLAHTPLPLFTTAEV
jgi:hypothetical protein